MMIAKPEKDAKENIPFSCPRCGEESSGKDYEENGKVCPRCNYHGRLSWQERLAVTADEGSFVEFDRNMKTVNPIGFPGYEEKIAGFQKECQSGEAVVTGECTIQGYRTVIAVMDSRFMMSSMGSVVGEKISRAFEYAAEYKRPLVIFTASGGARMQEGIFSLMQMAKTAGAAGRLGAAGQLYITVIADPTTGGVTASFASLGDIIIAEPGVLVGFAGKRVIQDTIGEKLPDGFQTAEFLCKSGFADMIVDRKNMRCEIARLLYLHRYPRETA